MTPRLSIVVVVFNMQREAPRTLFSLSPEYQQGVSAGDYEVVLVDNGSQHPLTRELFASPGSVFKHLRIDNGKPSPAAALNHGVAHARGRFVGLMIDGARLATPGIIREALQCLDAHERAVVATLGFHLGPELQSISLQHGYDQTAEDRLLEKIAWRENGYRLFEISALAGSSRYGVFHSISESNLLFVSRQLHDELGGADERFDLPGGGMVNLDLYRRACELPGTTLFVLLGEATFHQVHGGAHTGVPLAEADRLSLLYSSQYAELRGAAFQNPERSPVYFGTIRPEVLPWLQKSCDLVRKRFGEQRPCPLPEEDLRGPGPRKRDQVDVDPPRRRDLLQALPFGLLTLLGLKQDHRVLEVGPLAASGLLSTFLYPGNYYGIVPYLQQTGTGMDDERWQELVAGDAPHAIAGDDFDLEVFGTGFDFILAQTMLYHAGHVEVGRFLTSVRRVLRPEGLLVAAFVEHDLDQAANEWVYPELNYYSWPTISRICAACGLHCQKIDWPHPLKTWFVAAVELHRLQAVAAAGVTALPDEQMLTGAKRQALDQALVEDQVDVRQHSLAEPTTRT